MNPWNLSTLFEVISTPPSRVVGDDICSSQEFRTTRFQSFADRSARRREQVKGKERETEKKERQKQEIESRFIWNDDIEKKKDDETPRREQPRSPSVFSTDRINCYDRYQHIRQELPWSLPLASCCCSLIDTLKLHFFPFRYFFLICELQPAILRTQDILLQNILLY